MIATDVVARGMDFKGVNRVINFDFPDSAAAYIHRIGTCSIIVLVYLEMFKGMVIVSCIIFWRSLVLCLLYVYPLRVKSLIHTNFYVVTKQAGVMPLY